MLSVLAKFQNEHITRLQRIEGSVDWKNGDSVQLMIEVKLQLRKKTRFNELVFLQSLSEDKVLKGGQFITVLTVSILLTSPFYNNL